MSTNYQMSPSESFANWVFEITSADWRLWAVLFGASLACGPGAMSVAVGLLLGSLIQGRVHEQ